MIQYKSLTGRILNEAVNIIGKLLRYYSKGILGSQPG
jgi:hypothetical protein